MKKRDLLFAGLLLFGASAFAQPTYTAQDAKVIFTQDFEALGLAFQGMGGFLATQETKTILGKAEIFDKLGCAWRGTERRRTDKEICRQAPLSR